MGLVDELDRKSKPKKDFWYVVISALKKQGLKGNIKCPHCHKIIRSWKGNNVEFDHYRIPKSKGGGFTIRNMRFMHKKCNRHKGVKKPTHIKTKKYKKRDKDAIYIMGHKF